MRRVPTRRQWPPRTPTLQYELKEPEQLDVSTFYSQRQTMQEWLFASMSTYRSPSTLPTLHRCVLIYGLASLQQRITGLINLDLQLYHKYYSLLTDNEIAEQTYAYTGLPWEAAIDGKLELMNREHLEWLLGRYKNL
ncbi:hypothetical protein PtrSN002B_008020 [Pyrenophora tritici-repentis]|uniref:Uncharacterized protein n=2 Tax=Pyrenophora tritici-repentis TaxID=45151 RepID=A0A316ZZ74_9PLEO|nr:uncharacterized protein PTRG_01824 [Pyrenophora tritici-repentis Pt-1C-BFP]KAA8626531.1 hypothetical protein PtrV1_02211 [Pyrenophora tritici-repentis]EDU41262.1 predicted protein [Pyrenophora tritici-repentis Pt-1C-BFP]KAF7454957.1 hypothetical protein A1F99_022150 [Pyrenophora tritici-repentis]KAF7578108.1 hypothetical protein PtrM4_023480 [Pyrenophora tritici-repentis]KAG9388717.1 hypothetical protein A1F94_001610 [Pyrenophora tritici-repentis]